MRIAPNPLRVTVVGTGYVGLVTGACLAELGHDVTCIDTATKRVSEVNRGVTPFHEPGLSEIMKRCIGAGRLRASSDTVSSVANGDVTFLAVGTPSTADRIDLSYLSMAAEQVGKGIRESKAYHVVVVKSTVVPYTTDTHVRTLLEKFSGIRAGAFGLCMNPEFLREGSAVDDFMNPDRIVIGQLDDRSGARVSDLYAPFDCPKLFTTLRNAEMTKYASNALLATLISFSNELSALCEATPETDIEEVLSAIHLDRRFAGTKDSPAQILTYLRAGSGFGGSCLPKDLTALRHYARQVQVEPTLLDAVAEVNSMRPSHVLARAEQALGQLRGLTVAVIGLAFKPGTDDVRDSPALAIIERLRSKGAVVKAYDPLIRGLPDCDGITLHASAGEALENADAAIIATAWPEFSHWDWRRLCSLMRRPVIVDGRNVLASLDLGPNATYVPIGKHFAPQGATVGN